MNTKLAQEKLSNFTNTTKQVGQQVFQTVQGMNTVQKIALVVLSILLIIFLVLIVMQTRQETAEQLFANQPTFITEKDVDFPHNAMKVYKYTDPSTGSSIPFIPAKLIKEVNGIHYTYSFWIYLDATKFKYRFNHWKHIFHRGDRPKKMTCEDENMPIEPIDFQLPGFWISPRTNKLHCILTTAGQTNKHVQERIVLDDLELNKWTNIVLVLDRRNVALYRNGLLERTISLANPANINNNNLYVTHFCGFPGYLAYLQFFNRALEPSDVYTIYRSYLKNIKKHAEKPNQIPTEEGEDEEEISDYVPDRKALFGDFGMISQEEKNLSI